MHKGQEAGTSSRGRITKYFDVHGAAGAKGRGEVVRLQGFMVAQP